MTGDVRPARLHRHHRPKDTRHLVVDRETAQGHRQTVEVATCACGATRRTEIDRGPWTVPAERIAP